MYSLIFTLFSHILTLIVFLIGFKKMGKKMDKQILSKHGRDYVFVVELLRYYMFLIENTDDIYRKNSQLSEYIFNKKYFTIYNLH